MYLLCVGVLLIWTNISKFQFDQGRGSAWKPAKGDVVSSLHIVIYLFIYFILFYFWWCKQRKYTYWCFYQVVETHVPEV